MTTEAARHPDILPNGRIRPPGLDEALIDAVVERFYARVRADALLAPVFDTAVAPEAWPGHLRTIADFWSSNLLGTERYHGRPLPKHLALPGITDAHFARWLDLFRLTTEELCVPETAAHFVERAERIAHSFRLGIAIHRGEDSLGIAVIRARAP